MVPQSPTNDVASIPELHSTESSSSLKALINSTRSLSGKVFPKSIAGYGTTERPVSLKDMIIPDGLNLVLEFHNLTYSVQKQQHRNLKSRAGNYLLGLGGRGTRAVREEVKLLHDISGVVRGGEILAVMGPSGSGKSTLIDALVGRIASKSLHGSITLNGEEVTNNSILQNISAYVSQDDLLFPMLTVKETLTFAAQVCLPNSYSEKQARVHELMEQLSLTRVGDTIIGDEGHRGVSGGERRRVSIGKEIIHDPLLLFLDEPTSGLDSNNAHMLICTLQNIARTGSIVILSAHQPSDRLLELFTTLLFIADGQTIYRGPPSHLHDYFTRSLGYTLPDEGSNIAEFALDLMQEFSTGHEQGVTPMAEVFRKLSENLGSDDSEFVLHSKFCDSSDPESLHPVGVKGALAASIARGKLIGATGYVKQYDDCETFVRKFANSWVYEVYTLAWRAIVNMRRTPELSLMRLATVTVSGFLLATIFWRLDRSPKGLQERLGFYAFAMSTTYYSCVDTLPIYLQERFIFMRETSHNSYRKSSYVIASALINIPFLLILSVAFSCTTFWTVGLSGGAAEFTFFLLIVWASFWAGNSFATFLSAVITNVILGYTIVVASLAYFLLLSGFFINRDRIPNYWLWFHYLSLIKYPYEAVLLNEFGGSNSACYETGSQILSGTPFAGSDEAADYVLETLRAILQGTVYEEVNRSSCLINGALVLRDRNINQLSKWTCLGITAIFGFVYRLLFYVVLRIAGKSKRH